MPSLGRNLRLNKRSRVVPPGAVPVPQFDRHARWNMEGLGRRVLRHVHAHDLPPDPCHGDDEPVFQQVPDVSLDRLLLGYTPGDCQVVGVTVPEVAVKAQAHDPVIGGLNQEAK